MSRVLYLKRGGHVRYPPRCKTCEPRPLVGRRLKMLVLLCLIATSPLLQLAAGVSSELYPFGDGSLDSSLGPNDDGSSSPITLLRPFPFFDEDRTTVFVSLRFILELTRRQERMATIITCKVAKLFLAKKWVFLQCNSLRFSGVYYLLPPPSVVVSYC